MDYVARPGHVKAELLVREYKTHKKEMKFAREIAGVFAVSGILVIIIPIIITWLPLTTHPINIGVILQHFVPILACTGALIFVSRSYNTQCALLEHQLKPHIESGAIERRRRRQPE